MIMDTEYLILLYLILMSLSSHYECPTQVDKARVSRVVDIMGGVLTGVADPADNNSNNRKYFH
jgi:hypothetical protein